MIKNDSVSSSRVRGALVLRGALCVLIALSCEVRGEGVQIDDAGRLTVDVHDQDPVAVVQEIADLAPFRLQISDGVETTRGSWSFNAFPIETGIRRVLGNIDYILTRRDADDPNSGIERVWILSKSTPVTSVTTFEKDTKVKAGSLAQSPDDALKIIAEATKLDEAERIELLLGYMDHPEPRVRLALAGALGRVDGQEAVAALGQMMFSDEDSSVRRAAATALAENHSAAAIEMLRGGLEDADRQVQDHIRDILSEIDHH